MRAGVRLALDIGARRIGVARCDAEAIPAVPVAVLDGSDDAWHQDVAALVAEYQPLELIIGDPVSLRGTAEMASAAVRVRAASLHAAIPSVPVRLVDERLTTATAARRLRDVGKNARAARRDIDAAAAVEILEFALDVERRTGTPAGELL